jgi:hypothetical protein
MCNFLNVSWRSGCGATLEPVEKSLNPCLYSPAARLADAVLDTSKAGLDLVLDSHFNFESLIAEAVVGASPHALRPPGERRSQPRIAAEFLHRRTAV